MRYVSILVILALAGCTQAPPVKDSRELLWAQYGGHKIDDLLLSWGPPAKETRLTDGSRLVTYRHSTVYEGRGSSEQGSSCEVSFMAKSPKYMIGDIAMAGSDNECRLLAQGRTGDVRVPAIEPIAPYRYPYPYNYPYRYRY